MSADVMPAQGVLAILAALAETGVDARLSGGWAVDALLGEQTREHRDVDLWVPASDTPGLLATLVRLGIDRVAPRPGDAPWNFVLHDPSRGLAVDLHLWEPLPDGNVHYGSHVSGYLFPAAALDGHGTIEGVAVRCEAAQWSVRWHIGYPARTVDRHDVVALCTRFGIARPAGFD